MEDIGEFLIQNLKKIRSPLDLMVEEGKEDV